MDALPRFDLQGKITPVTGAAADGYDQHGADLQGRGLNRVGNEFTLATMAFNITRLYALRMA